MEREKTHLLAVIVLVITSIANANPVLTVNGFDTSMPVEINADDGIVIAIKNSEETIGADYTITTTEGELLEISQSTKVKKYILKLKPIDTLAVVDLHSTTEHLHQLAIFYTPTQNITTVFGINKKILNMPYTEQVLTETPLIENLHESVTENSEPQGNMASSAAGYDIVLSGINKYETPQSYSNQSILVLEDGVAVYNKGVIFENCIIDVNGFIELNLDVNLVDSNISVFGNLKVEPGTTITKTGVSNITITGNSIKSGEICLKGNLYDRIKIYSDHNSSTEFIIIDSNSSDNSIIKYVDFYGGWCNIQIYDKNLNEGITSCRFFQADYPIWQNGIDNLTSVKFCFFYRNLISIYLSADDYDNEVDDCLIDNVVIDNAYETNTYGIVLSSSTSDFYGIRISNSIIVNTYCGWYIDAASFYPPLISNIAYCDNYYNDNIGEPSFQKNPMYLSQSPFVAQSDPNIWPYYIEPNSVVADVNLGYDLWQDSPGQLLTSLFEDSTPRGNKGIGFGVPVSANYATKAGELTCDIFSDGIVNNKDFAKFAADWGSTGTLLGDFDKDGKVDVNDFDILSHNWLKNSYIEPNITENGDYLTFTCPEINDLNLIDCAIFIDGEYIASREPNDNPVLLIDKRKYANGIHELKAVIRGDNSKPYITATRNISFESTLSSITFPEIFDPCNYYIIKGSVETGHTATISVNDLDNSILWSDTFSDDFITLVDPNVFSDQVSYTINYSANGAIGKGAILALKGKRNYKVAMLIICMVSTGMKDGVNHIDMGTCRYACKAAKDRGIIPLLLRGYGEHSEVTWKMFKRVFKKYRGIKYIHLNSHGHHRADERGWSIGSTPRTLVRFNDGIWPSYNSRMWTDRDMNVPEDYVYLGDGLEENRCLAMFPFKTGTIRILVMESCYGLRNVATQNHQGLIEYVDGAYDYEEDNHLNAHPDYPYSDISFAFRITNDKGIAIGSAKLVIKDNVLYQDWEDFFNYFWYGLRIGKNVYDSLIEEAIPHTSQGVMWAWRQRGIGDISHIYLTTSLY